MIHWLFWVRGQRTETYACAIWSGAKFGAKFAKICKWGTKSLDTSFLPLPGKSLWHRVSQLEIFSDAFSEFSELPFRVYWNFVVLESSGGNNPWFTYTVWVLHPLSKLAVPRTFPLRLYIAFVGNAPRPLSLWLRVCAHGSMGSLSPRTSSTIHRYLACPQRSLQGNNYFLYYCDCDDNRQPCMPVKTHPKMSFKRRRGFVGLNRRPWRTTRLNTSAPRSKCTALDVP